MVDGFINVDVFFLGECKLKRIIRKDKILRKSSILKMCVEIKFLKMKKFWIREL